jgi:hypothetical protein
MYIDLGGLVDTYLACLLGNYPITKMNRYLFWLVARDGMISGYLYGFLSSYSFS